MGPVPTWSLEVLRVLVVELVFLGRTAWEPKGSPEPQVSCACPDLSEVVSTARSAWSAAAELSCGKQADRAWLDGVFVGCLLGLVIAQGLQRVVAGLRGLFAGRRNVASEARRRGTRGGRRTPRADSGSGTSSATTSSGGVAVVLARSRARSIQG